MSAPATLNSKSADAAPALSVSSMTWLVQALEIPALLARPCGEIVSASPACTALPFWHAIVQQHDAVATLPVHLLELASPRRFLGDDGEPYLFIALPPEVSRSAQQAVKFDPRDPTSSSPLSLDQKAELLDIILDQMHEAVAVIDSSGRSIVNNRRAREILGDFPVDLPPEQWQEAVGIFQADGVTPCTLADNPFVNALVLGEVQSDLEVCIRNHATGGNVWIRGSCSPLRSASGEIFGALAVYRDATQQRAMEQSLRESEARFRNVADSAPVLIWMSGPDRRCTYCNLPWQVFTGKTLNEELGSTWSEGIHPEDLPSMSAAFEAAFAERRPFQMEYRLRRYDGAYRWVLDHGTPLQDPAGTFQGYLGSCVDITERKEAEQRLREEQDRFDLVVRGAAVGIWQWTSHDNRNYFSSRFCEMLGYKPNELDHSHETFVELVHPEDRSKVNEAALRHLLERVPYECDFRMRTRNGHYKWVRGSGQAEWDPDGRPIRMAGTVSDITQLKLIEEVLLESNALLEQKVNERTAELERANARLSQEMQQRVLAEQQRHQLQRELAVAEELQRRHIARELHDELGQLVVSLQLAIRNGASGAEDATIGSEYWPRLDALADEINQAAHRVARQLRPTALDDQGLIPALVDLLDEWSRQAMIEVDWEAATFQDAEFSLAVKSAIYRTVQEALTNVLKHARATRVSVVLERSAFGVTLIIEDNGAGFDPEWLTTISARRMGLRGMRERVELAGGSLEFESAPEGGGTTIFVRLPLEQLGSLGADN